MIDMDRLQSNILTSQSCGTAYMQQNVGIQATAITYQQARTRRKRIEEVIDNSQRPGKFRDTGAAG